MAVGAPDGVIKSLWEIQGVDWNFNVTNDQWGCQPHKYEADGNEWWGKCEKSKHLQGQFVPPVNCDVFAYSRPAPCPKLLCRDKNVMFGKNVCHKVCVCLCVEKWELAHIVLGRGLRSVRAPLSVTKKFCRREGEYFRKNIFLLKNSKR